jgi:asparagine synthetase B (glutamine-hydrolysing)
MPLLFGCVNGSNDAAEQLRSQLIAGRERLETIAFAGGWIAASGHGTHIVTGGDGEGRTWGLFGEPGLRPLDGNGSSTHFQQRPTGELMLSPNARGVLAVFDEPRRRMTIACDAMNYFPVYYWQQGGQFLFGSNLKAVVRLTRAGPDHAGIAELLRSNWCLNGRTVAAGIRKILPGQQIVFDARTEQLSVLETSQLWSGVAADKPAPSDEEIWQRLLRAVETAAHPDATAGLMLSGGWDSRVLLAALKHVFGERVVTLSHGTPQQGELVLSRQLAQRVGVRHLEIELGEDVLGRPRELDALLDTTDTILFPWWRYGSRALREAGCTTGFTGLLGEVLGGHYTVVGRGRSRRAREVFRRLVLRNTGHAVPPADGLRRVLAHDFRARTIPFLKKELTDGFAGAISAGVAHDTEAVIGRYVQRGIGDAGRMVEAYNTEYRALDYFCQQPVMLTADLDVATPLGDPQLVEAILAVPLTRRIHNSLSRNILRQYRPELLRVPLAASPFVAAGAPILVQEGGRVARRVVDLVSKQLYLRSAGRRDTRLRYGWVDFERAVRSGDYLDDWRDSLTWEGLDRHAIDQYVTKIKTHETTVRLGRTIVKLAYLDRLFAPRGGGHALEGVR